MKRSKVMAATRRVNAELDEMLAAAGMWKGTPTILKAVRAKGSAQRKSARVCGGQADLYAQMRILTEE